MEGKRQRDFYFIRKPTRAIIGYFYQDGKRTMKTLCRLDEAGLDEHGELFSKNKTALARFESFVMGLWQKKQQELDQAPRRPKSAEQSIESLMQEWLDVSESEKAPRTVKHHYLPTVNSYIQIVGNHPVMQFNLRKIDSWKIGLNRSGLSGTSINIKLRSMRTFINWVREREPGFQPAIPWAKVFINVEKKIPGVLSKEEFLKLLARVSNLAATGGKSGPDKRRQMYYQLHHRYIMVASATGCRLSEIYWQTWDQIDLENSLLYIRKNENYTPKNKRESARYLPGYLVKYLAEQRGPDEVYLFDNGHGRLAYSDPHAFSTAFSRHFKKLGITGVKATHGFRAGFATTLRNELGQDLRTIQDLMGLSNVAVLDHYFSNINQPQIEAIKKLDESVNGRTNDAENRGKFSAKVCKKV